LHMRRIADLSRFKHGRFPKGVLLLGVAIFVLASGVYVTAVRLEANDSFCASCHVEPESTYYRASLKASAAATLAAFHAGKETRCIDCHSRRWIPGRLWAQWGGLQNVLAYRSGHYDQPSITTRPVGDSGCSKCHSDLTWVSERPGHYHSPGLRRSWRASSGPANSCQVCHPSHESNASASDSFMDEKRIEMQCDACHEAIGEGAINTFN
ncbi:MAG: NapC/NirT family cytochrome c, partial [Anaerolineae bacterium]